MIPSPIHVFTTAYTTAYTIAYNANRVQEISNAVSVAAGTDNCFAITKDGEVYSWGFSENYQTGQGITTDVPLPTLIENTAIKGKKIVYAGAGGQFSILAGIPA